MYDRYNSPRIYVNVSGKLPLAHLIAGKWFNRSKLSCPGCETGEHRHRPPDEVDTKPLLVNVLRGKHYESSLWVDFVCRQFVLGCRCVRPVAVEDGGKIHYGLSGPRLRLLLRVGRAPTNERFQGREKKHHEQPACRCERQI